MKKLPDDSCPALKVHLATSSGGKRSCSSTSLPARPMALAPAETSAHLPRQSRIGWRNAGQHCRGKSQLAHAFHQCHVQVVAITRPGTGRGSALLVPGPLGSGGWVASVRGLPPSPARRDSPCGRGRRQDRQRRSNCARAIIDVVVHFIADPDCPGSLGRSAAYASAVLGTQVKSTLSSSNSVSLLARECEAGHHAPTGPIRRLCWEHCYILQE